MFDKVINWNFVLKFEKFVTLNLLRKWFWNDWDFYYNIKYVNFNNNNYENKKHTFFFQPYYLSIHYSTSLHLTLQFNWIKIILIQVNHKCLICLFFLSVLFNFLVSTPNLWETMNDTITYMIGNSNIIMLLW